MTWDEEKARALDVERTTRELTVEVRRLAAGLDDIAALRVAQQRTRRTLGAVAVGLVAALLASTALVMTVLLIRVNNLIDERRDSVQAACVQRNQETDDRREFFAKLAQQDKNSDIWTQMVRSLPAKQIDCSTI